MSRNETEADIIERLVQAVYFSLLDLERIPKTPELQVVVDRLEGAIGYSHETVASQG